MSLAIVLAFTAGVVTGLALFAAITWWLAALLRRINDFEGL